MKVCPFCAEAIQDAAIVCKHCGRDVAPRSAPSPPPTIGGPSRERPLVDESRQYVLGRPSERLWNPGVAAVLSFLIPGLGQIYKGEIGNGIAWLVVVILGYFLFIVPGIALHIWCIVKAASGDPYYRG